MKNTKNKIDLHIDLTEIDNAHDVYVQFAIEKVFNTLTVTEINNLTNQSIKKTFYICSMFGNIQHEKKPNVVKRFWNWITSKNKQSK